MRTASPEEAQTWIRSLLVNCDALHRAGFVHRDIKAANVIVHGESTSLIDFELARERGAAEAAGTPYHVAPEVLLGAPHTAASDLFSVGVILYQFFSGRRPFNADTMATLLYQITREEPPPLSEVAPTEANDVPSAM